MNLKQKIKEFETILIQELKNTNGLDNTLKLGNLISVYRDQFRTELEDNVFTNDVEIHKMD
jgi:hypothetical protein